MRKKQFPKVLSVILLAFSCLVFASCNDVTTETASPTTMEAQASYAKTLSENINYFLDQPVVEHNKNSRSKAIVSTETIREEPVAETTDIFVGVPEECTLSNIDEIVTTRDLVDLVKTTGATISLVDDGNSTYTLSMSNEAVSQSLEPLVASSRQYLLTKGMTGDDIQEMLDENETDETALVPLVLALVEQEADQPDFSQDPGCVYKADLSKAADCAAEALGVDIVTHLAGVGGATWSKAVIKKVFKTVAKRMLGPISVAICVAEFSVCMY